MKYLSNNNSFTDIYIDAAFDIDSEMRDVEVFHISENHILAKGKRFGRLWLLKGLPPHLKNSPADLKRLQTDFVQNAQLLNPGVSMVVSFENIPEVGPCIVEEWVEGTPLPDLLQKGTLSKSQRRDIVRNLLEINDDLKKN